MCNYLHLQEQDLHSHNKHLYQKTPELVIAKELISEY